LHEVVAENHNKKFNNNNLMTTTTGHRKKMLIENLLAGNSETKKIPKEGQPLRSCSCSSSVHKSGLKVV